VHLVGHSYGGGVALHVAHARPDRIASLALYEPSAFYLLKQLGDQGTAALSEIVAIAGKTGEAVARGDHRAAAAAFVDYWSGQGAWEALRPGLQDALIRWAPKAPLDFAALIEEPILASAYRRLRFPTLVIRGEHAPAPTRLIADSLPFLMPSARLSLVAGAGHMGPLTHSEKVNALIAKHVENTKTTNRQVDDHQLTISKAEVHTSLPGTTDKSRPQTNNQAPLKYKSNGPQSLRLPASTCFEHRS
jgi:pimeloyl-ACP methyl ester carboxylesterase